MKRIVTHLSLLAATAILATGCVPVRHNLPPEQQMMEPGPGVGGPGPGVLGSPAMAPGMMGGPMMGGPMMGNPMMGGPTMGAGALMQSGVPAQGYSPAMSQPMGSSASMQGEDLDLVNYTCGPECSSCSGNGGCLPGGGGGGLFGGHAGLGSNIPPGGGVMSGAGMGPMIPPTLQVTFGYPEGMQVRYDATGGGGFDSEPLVVPARQNFPQGGLYRIKLTNIPAREGVELYPTVELAYANPRTGAFLAHNSVPIQLTEEDFDQVLTGNFVTKVIYLPDPDFQGPALAGIDTLVSTRLDPGIDPIVEADRRGSILAIIRLGDKDIEMAGVGGFAAGGGYFAPPIAGLPAPYAPAMTAGCGGPGGFGGGGAGGFGDNAPLPMSLPGMVAGVTAPQYGMPMSGTPIGLPGPPHIPLGTPAGLKKHVIRNHTHMNIPRPTEKVSMHVRLQPGMSYPAPADRVHITEQNVHPGIPNGRGLYQHQSQQIDPSTDPNCPPQ
jgi:hypothetical protein